MIIGNLIFPSSDSDLLLWTVTYYSDVASTNAGLVSGIVVAAVIILASIIISIIMIIIYFQRKKQTTDLDSIA